MINVDSILSVDSLLNYPIGVNAYTPRMNNSFVVPNPVINKSAIYFVHPHANWSKYTLKVWSMHGKKINLPYTVKEGYIEIQKGNLPAGVYLYGILDGHKKLSAGKIIIQ